MFISIGWCQILSSSMKIWTLFCNYLLLVTYILNHWFPREARVVIFCINALDEKLFNFGGIWNGFYKHWLPFYRTLAHSPRKSKMRTIWKFTCKPVFLIQKFLFEYFFQNSCKTWIFQPFNHWASKCNILSGKKAIINKPAALWDLKYTLTQCLTCRSSLLSWPDFSCKCSPWTLRWTFHLCMRSIRCLQYLDPA